MKQSEKFKLLPKTKPVGPGLTIKMVTAMPDPDYCPDILYPDGTCCMDYRQIDGIWVCEPDWWRKIAKEARIEKTKAQKVKEQKEKDEQAQEQQTKEQQSFTTTTTTTTACDNCKKYRNIKLWAGKGKNRRARMAMLCGISEIIEKKKECGEKIPKE